MIIPPEYNGRYARISVRESNTICRTMFGILQLFPESGRDDVVVVKRHNGKEELFLTENVERVEVYQSTPLKTEEP